MFNHTASSFAKGSGCVSRLSIKLISFNGCLQSNSMLEAVHAAAASKYRTEHLRLEDASSRVRQMHPHAWGFAGMAGIY